ncbi:MAG: hypothetical protein LBS33_01625, partial [Streptococcaceae bacterium]|nr:hypothetical protein [Streptococcaceae bacterium]
EFFSKEDIRTLKAIFVKIIKHERLGIELFTSTVFIALLISIFEYYPLLFAKYSIPEVFFGSIFSCFILIGFLSISFFEKHEKNDRLYIVLLLLTAISFGLLASQSLILVIFAIFIQEFSFSFILTRISKVILDNIWDKRISSSYQSMVSFYDSIVRLTIPLILLVLMKWFSFSLTVIMISVMSFLIGVIYLMKIIKINWRK